MFCVSEVVILLVIYI